MYNQYEDPANDAQRIKRRQAMGQQMGQRQPDAQQGTPEADGAGAAPARPRWQPPTGQPQTFAQMQAQGMARPAPPPPPAPVQPATSAVSPVAAGGSQPVSREMAPADQHTEALSALTGGPQVGVSVAPTVGGDPAVNQGFSALVGTQGGPMSGVMPYTGDMVNTMGGIEVPQDRSISDAFGALTGGPALPPAAPQPTLTPSGPTPALPGTTVGTPALPSASPVPSGGTSSPLVAGSASGGAGGPAIGSGGGVNGALESRVSSLLANPSGYNDQALKDEFTRESGTLDDQFAQQNTALREEMARRGLADSSIQGGRLADLNVSRRSAGTDLAERLATDAAKAYGTDNASAIAAALGLTGQKQAGEIAQGQLGLGYAGLANQAQIANAQLTQQGQQFGATNALDQARLAEQERQYNSNYGLDTAKFQQGQQEFAANYGLDASKADEAKRQFDASYGLDASKQAEAQREFDANYGQGAYQFQASLKQRQDEEAQSGLQALLDYLNSADFSTTTTGSPSLVPTH